MGQSNRALIFLLMGIMGVWAIAQSNDLEREELVEKIQHLESQIFQKEQSERDLVRQREETSQKLVERETKVSRLEAEKALLEKEIAQLQIVFAERDQLQKELAERTTERDGMEGRCAQLKKGLLDLLEKDEFAARESVQPFQKANLTTKTSKTPGTTASRRKESDPADKKD